MQFGVGRTSVREALRSLAAMGVVETRAGDGTFVSASGVRCLERTVRWGILLDARLVEDLIETRLMLESHTAALAARKASADDLAEMRAALIGMKQSLDDRDRYLECDLQFHEAVAKATQNTILQSLIGTTRGYLQTWILETLESSPQEDSTRRARKSVAEHQKVLRAIE
jgi:DNA-binding FadR family transcriptional regulator